MAKHFSEVKRELEQSDGHMAGIGQQLKLSEEARDARNAGRRLEDENDETDLIGTMKKLEDLIAEQRQSNERIAKGDARHGFGDEGCARKGRGAEKRRGGRAASGESDGTHGSCERPAEGGRDDHKERRRGDCKEQEGHRPRW